MKTVVASEARNLDADFKPVRSYPYVDNSFLVDGRAYWTVHTPYF